MNDNRSPQIAPGGEANVLSTISQSLAFHSSPESFLSARRTAYERIEGNSAPSIVRAKILNRDVVVISSHKTCADILSATDGSRSSQTESSIHAAREAENISQSTFGVLPAYRELMVDFFPAPNLLLLDAPHHEHMRKQWDEHMSQVSLASPSIIRDIVTQELASWSHNSQIDLYDKMKDLAWQCLLAIFLNVNPGQKKFSTIVSLQENLLRGQFSLFPVSINTPFWRSARSRGLDSRAKLQTILKETVDSEKHKCPFTLGNDINKEELASNSLLFTSSIAVKAIASLLTASLLNLFLFPGDTNLASLLQEKDLSERDTLLESILLETERLSPPVVGVMRRAQQDIVISDGTAERPPTLVPAGWDTWLYFVAADRDPSVYKRASQFVPERFLSERPPPSGLAFGLGEKTCLGREVSRQIVRVLAFAMLDSGVSLQGSVEAEGVRGWLGWDQNVPVELMARDLKQLPCQRPRKPIKVRVIRRKE